MARHDYGAMEDPLRTCARCGMSRWWFERTHDTCLSGLHLALRRLRRGRRR